MPNESGTDAQRVKETLAALVGINSISSRSNREIMDFLRTRCESMGMRTELHRYTDEGGVEKLNLVGITGPASPSAEGFAELALVGHTDTVPYDAAWTGALRLTEREGKLYGRGACDTKGFIAAALTAVERLDRSRLKRPLALVLTADEEVGCLGAKQLAETGALKCRYSIVGEPTSLRPMRAGKGYCLAEVVTRGREGHSAYPALGASAIFRAARLISRLEGLAEELKTRDRAEAFEPPYTSLNVGLVRGGTAKNIIAGRCVFTLEWRPVPGQKAEYVLDLLRAMIEDERRREPDFDCEIGALRLDESMETRADSALVRMLEEATGQPSGTIAFGTEAPQMVEMGAQAVVLGPGDIRVAHRTEEFVPVEELSRCVEILSRAIERFCIDEPD